MLAVATRRRSGPCGEYVGQVVLAEFRLAHERPRIGQFDRRPDGAGDDRWAVPINGDPGKLGEDMRAHGLVAEDVRDGTHRCVGCARVDKPALPLRPRPVTGPAAQFGLELRIVRNPRAVVGEAWVIDQLDRLEAGAQPAPEVLRCRQMRYERTTVR